MGNFNVGDYIVVKNIRSIKRIRGAYSTSTYVVVPGEIRSQRFYYEFEPVCGRLAVVTAVDGDNISVEFDNPDGLSYSNFTFNHKIFRKAHKDELPLEIFADVPIEDFFGFNQ